jgi:hypothetical protein
MDTGFFPGVNRPGREIDHNLLSTAEVKNEWSYNFTPPTRLYGVGMDNTLLLLSTQFYELQGKTKSIPSMKDLHKIKFSDRCCVERPKNWRPLLANM